MRCPSCAKEIQNPERFCSSCGARLPLDPDLTESVAPDRNPVVSIREVSHSRLVTGTVIAGRYRIITLLGKGGMGEVYRAEDLELEQEVALKFLPKQLRYDGAALARLHREVRTARQVSHRNVCRVFDIEDANGTPFLTMEYVDGEDLRSLLRRIGRFPQDRGIDLARQICSGLAAAHEYGILHRDLKPANIMVDAKGRARIMDFGLATLAHSAANEDIRAGTPSYMAPEQFEGGTLTLKSDIYSLGLVLYEIFTGEQVFQAASSSELLRQRRRSSIKSPSTVVKDLDPLVDDVIVQCLQEDTAKRPASAIRVAVCLPGGDPVRAALAAGETPSPEMIAASGSSGGLRPVVAWGLLVSTLLLMAVTISLESPTRLYTHIKQVPSPEILGQRAREFIQDIGHGGPAIDEASGFVPISEYMNYIGWNNRSVSASRWENLSPLSFIFWYRQSPQFMVSNSFIGDVSSEEPPFNIPGMIGLKVDASGRITQYIAVPAEKDDALSAVPSPEWNRFLTGAGYEAADWSPVAPLTTPPTYSDARAAFQGKLSDLPDVSTRVEMAAYHGQLVFLETIFPWSQNEHKLNTTAADWIGSVSLAVVGIMLLGAIWLSRRNVLKGRGDRNGAFHLALFVLIVTLTISILSDHHVPDAEEILVMIKSISFALLVSASTWVLYLALEPLARRHWPSTMVSWSRVLSGRLRDPLVGRDVLIGSAFGILFSALEILSFRSLHWVGGGQTVHPSEIFAGGRTAVVHALTRVNLSLVIGLGLFLFIALLRAFLRRNWLVYGIFVLLSFVMTIPSADFGLKKLGINLGFGILLNVLILIILIRFGLIALIVSFYVSMILGNFPITFETSAWYFGTGLLGLFIPTALVVCGFYFSLAGKPAFGSLSIDE